MSKETILKEFDNEFTNSPINFSFIREEVRQSFSKAIDQTREETIREAIRNIEKIKIAVAKQTGAYKYNSCYEDCIDILNKLK